MPKVPRTVLKEYFQTGDKPSAAQFGIFIDSTVNFVDDRDFIGLREYNPAADYLPGDCAVFNDQVVRCLNATTGPYDPADWTVLAAFGSVTYMGSWDTQANVPFLASGVGTQGFYYVVTNASIDPGDNTDLDGTSDWVTGDWAIFNGSIWERVDYSQAPYAAQNVSFVPTVNITSTNAQDAIEEVYNDLSADLATAVGDLTTDINDVATDVSDLTAVVDTKADKIVPAATGNFAGLAADGNLIDSTKSAADFLPSTTEAIDIPFTPSGNIGAGDVQSAIEELDAEKQGVISLTPNFYPYADTSTSLADGVISNESNGVALTVGKVLRSAATNDGQISFGATGDEVRLTTDGSFENESKLLMTPTALSMHGPEVTVGITFGGPNLHLESGGIATLSNGFDTQLILSGDHAWLKYGTLGGIRTFPGPDSSGVTFINGGSAYLRLSNVATTLANPTGGAALSMPDSGDVDLYGTNVLISGSTIEMSTLSASTVPVVNSSSKIVSSSVTPTELGYLSGVTSAVQTQLTAKLPLAGGTMTGDLILNADPSVDLAAATKHYVDSLLGAIEKKSVIPFTFDQVYLTGSFSYVRIPLAITLPAAGTVYTGTSTTATLLIDYRILDPSIIGRVALTEWNATDGPIGTPIVEDIVPGTDSVWTRWTIGPFPIPDAAVTVSLMMLVDPGTQIEMEGATLILTYS